MAMSKIFIAEDDPALTRLLKLMLERAGHQISVFPSGEAALDALADDPPDALIMDIDRPDASGRALCERIDARLPQRTFPIFAMTSAHGDGDQAWTQEIHDLFFLEKPVSSKSLISPERD